MTLSAVLLAGGESRRMGCDKATINFEGEPLWRRQVNTLRQLGADKIFISARVDPPWRPNDIEFVADAGESLGPWSGLAATLPITPSTLLLALAIDMPLMTAAFLNSLRAKAECGRGIVPRLRGRYEPLAAIYPREAHVDLACASRAADYSLQNFVQRLMANDKVRVVDIGVSDQELFRNLNEPDDPLLISK